MRRYYSGLLRILLIGLILLLFAGFGGANAAEEANRAVEFVPLRTLTQEQAILQLYSNLELLGIARDEVLITTLSAFPNQLVIQGTRNMIDTCKQILNTIDPTPPAPPAGPPPAAVDNFTVKNLSPNELANKLDEVMNNFIGLVRLEPDADNFIVYAKNPQGEGKIVFYIPNYEQAVQAFNVQPQGFAGYQVYIRATENERPIITTVKQLIDTVDRPIAGRTYKVLNLYYIEIKEVINSLKSAGYIAVNTVDQEAIDSLRNGDGPIIYAAPQVSSTSNQLSTRFSGGGTGIQATQFSLVDFPQAIATTDINKLIVFGTPAEIASVEAYLKLIDIPARQVLIEAQVIELNVDNLDDLGLRQVNGLDDLISGTVNPVFPGESSANPSGNFFIYDDSNQPRGSFSASLAALVLDGRATVRARPKVVTVDGRQAVITIGRQVPVAQETVTGDHSTFDINFVPVGITLNIKPRIGQGGQEVQMQVNAVVSNVETLNNVVSELSLMAPEINTREVSTIVRIPNHQSLILGGLISTEEETRTYKVPILGDLPFIGHAFRRNRQTKDRTEIIIVLTPHVAEEIEKRPDSTVKNPYQIIDPYILPLGTQILDNLDNVLFPGEYVLKEVDIRGIDLTTGLPSVPYDQIVPYSSNDPVMLTLLQIIRKLKLVDNLDMMKGLELPPDVDEKTARYYAEAFLIAYVRHLNLLEPNEISVGRRLLVPSFPDPQESFAERELAWHTINYLALTRGNPLLVGVAETIRWMDENNPYGMNLLESPFSQPSTSAPSETQDGQSDSDTGNSGEKSESGESGDTDSGTSTPST